MRFGILSYSTYNLGDDLQTLAAMRFLPRVDVSLDRDYLPLYRALGPVGLIGNGWFLNEPTQNWASRRLRGLSSRLRLQPWLSPWSDKLLRLEKRLPRLWPPAPNLVPLWISVHISPEAAPTLLASPYLRRHGPVGCRDLTTLALLRQQGIPAWFSGCLTLTLPACQTPRGGSIVLVDTPPQVASAVPRPLRHHLVHRSHWLRSRERRGRMARARELLEVYRRARLVITTRLHSALPCLALGTPVVLVHPDPEGPRFGGLAELVRHCRPEDFPRWSRQLDWERPAPNPTRHLGLRAALQARCEEFVAQIVGRKQEGAR